MSETTDEYLEMINDCEDRESRLNEWECGFIESIRERIENNWPLSAKQIEKLVAIWDNATEKG